MILFEIPFTNFFNVLGQKSDIASLTVLVSHVGPVVSVSVSTSMDPVRVRTRASHVDWVFSPYLTAGVSSGFHPMSKAEISLLSSQQRIAVMFPLGCLANYIIQIQMNMFENQ